MKYYLVAGCVVVGAAAVFFMTQSQPVDAHEAWRQSFVEPETKERPASFEQMKFHPVEVRMPASDVK